MTTGSSPARGLGIAPAAGGLLGLFLGSFVAARLTQSSSSPDEAAVRLFAAFFWLFGLLFFGDALRGLRTGAGLRTRLGPLPIGLAALIVTGVAIAFHYAWTAPWSVFQWLVLFLDVLAVILVFLFITRLLAARRGTTSPRPQPLPANKAAARRQRFGFIAILFGTLGLLVGWLGMKQATSDWRAWSSAVRVDGVVTRQMAYNFRGRDGQPALNSAIVIRYQADGKSVRNHSAHRSHHERAIRKKRHRAPSLRPGVSESWPTGQRVRDVPHLGLAAHADGALPRVGRHGRRTGRRIGRGHLRTRLSALGTGSRNQC